MKIAQVRRLETRLLLDVLEHDRRAGERRVHRDRLVLFIVLIAVDERRVGSDRRGDGNASVADRERAGVVDAERDLQERAGLAEDDQRFDAGECGLPKLGDGRFLPVARLDLRAEALQFRIRVRRVAAPADEMERMCIVGHCNRGSAPQGFARGTGTQCVCAKRVPRNQRIRSGVAARDRIFHHRPVQSTE